MANTRRDFLAQSAIAAGALHAQTAPLDIFQAAAAGDVPRATELATADPHVVRARTPDGRTPLHFATANGKKDMVLFLGLKGAELSAGPESPLLAAVDFPDHTAASEMSQFLLANASDPNARRKDGKTALQLAQARDYRDLVEMLIHRGAESDDRQVERVHFDRRFLHDLEGRAVPRDDFHGLSWTEINPFVVLAHGNFDKVKELYTATPALLNTRASWDETAIEAAAHMGLLPMAEWLAERGAVISTCTAVLLGNAAMVKEAIAADRLVVHERGAHDFDILSFTAFAQEQAAIAEMLLAAGATVQAKAPALTTLHTAAQKGYLDLAEVLIHHGADVNAVAKSRGQTVTPLSLAAKAERQQMTELLRSKGAQ